MTMPAIIQDYELTAARICAAHNGDVNDLNPALRDYLRTINDLCQRAGGRLHSRQAIALAIIDWTLRYPAVPVCASRAGAEGDTVA